MQRGLLRFQWDQTTPTVTHCPTEQKSQHLTTKGHTFHDSTVRILNREDGWFEKGVKEAVYVNLKRPSLSRGWGLRHHLSTPSNTFTQHSLTNLWRQTRDNSLTWSVFMQCNPILKSSYTSFALLSFKMTWISPYLSILSAGSILTWEQVLQTERLVVQGSCFTQVCCCVFV